MKLRNQLASIFILSCPASIYAITVQAQSYTYVIDLTNLDTNYSHTLTVQRQITVSRITSLAAMAKPITFTLTCDSQTLGAATPVRFLTNMLNKPINFSVTADFSSLKCPSKSVTATLDFFGLESTSPTITYDTFKGELTDEGFYNVTIADFNIYAEELISYSATLSEQGASQDSFACVIKNAETKSVDSSSESLSGLIRELRTVYKNTFGVAYNSSSITCPPQNALKPRIDECNANPRLRTPFCNTLKLYNSSKTWFLETYKETKIRLQNLSNQASELTVNLENLKEDIRTEVELSDINLGISTEFPE
jgi:hypothetical protein